MNENMNFFVVGLNHKECPVEVRERLHFSPKRLTAALEEIKTQPEISEAVIVSTCNRVEFYGFGGSVFSKGHLKTWIERFHEIRGSEFEAYLYRHEGKDAIRHLFRVAAGLDSLVVGENEILGHLRDAFRAANEAGSVRSLLGRLMEKALKVGKEVRAATKINEGAVSIPSVAVELAEKIFGELGGEKVMVLGTGAMSEQTLENLRSAGAQALYVVSRSEERGRPLAEKFEAEWIPLEGWEPYLASVDICIGSTAAPHPIVHFDSVKCIMEKRRHRPLFLIDIAVPRDIEPHVNSIDDVYLYNIDDLKGVAAANLKRRSREVRAAEDLVERSVLDYQSWLERLKARPTLERFENFLGEILEKELAHFAREKGATEEEKNLLRDRIRAKLLHAPFEKIKEASQNGGAARYLEALHSLFDLDKRKQ